MLVLCEINCNLESILDYILYPKLILSNAIIAISFYQLVQLCMDAVLGTSSIPWRAHGIINSIKHFFVNRPSWLGSWVPRKANGAPHALAGWSFKSDCWGPLNFCYGPPSFVNACLADQGLLPMI